jgi:2-polyprenyl-6-hydroxyphenyl methylase/3-demethylubiquinone-9 3-methyltransferase
MTETPQALGAEHAAEVDRGDRFEFGENWRRFLSVLDEDRIAEAERSLRAMLGVEDLRGRTFVDVGSGSGLFSLAAARLGAERVHSFDFDPSSVACTAELRRRHGAEIDWTVEQGSALDADYLRGLGTFDIVYSWGVLHHTGDMWRALANVDGLVGPGGRLFISIYNDQGLRSRIWRAIKRIYNALPESLRTPYAVLVMGPRELLSLGYATARLKPWSYVRAWTQYGKQRGMSRWHDIIDWVGGYPFEVATPGEIFAFFRERDFTLERLVTRQGLGCNEFVLRRGSGGHSTPG